MWKIKQFMPKEKTGLEGRMIDIGDLKIHVRNVIAEGGFSCVYLAQDAINGSKQYALKHIICNDEESLEMVKKEISVMKSLQGHPNVVMLCAHTPLDMRRTKAALLVMEYCDKSLVDVLESRGAGFFEEKQILVMFRDVCNAVFAMHCQTPPIAHRDLKAENILLGSDGLWKLCDFGSTSTNHKRFEKPEEMGIEEDNIRKHTTPAYRSPEMWDLFLREVISEKVDIWALGCLLFRICYFKSAFDGESKLQVLNGNYRIPELPKYSSSITDLIRDMLQASPDARPDITQVWFRVNGLLPDGLQKSLPDSPPEMLQADMHEGLPKSANKASPMPRRSPPPPPTAMDTSRSPSPSVPSTGAPIGAFWSTQHAKDSSVIEEISKIQYDEEINTHERRNSSKDFELNFFQDVPEKPKSKSNDAFNAFAAEFGTNKVNSRRGNVKNSKEEQLEGEVERLKEELKKAIMEKSEINSKYEKLSAICRSQRQELHELKQALSSRTPSPIKSASKSQPSPGIRQQSPAQQGLFDKSSPTPDQTSWQPFSEDIKTPTLTTNNSSKSVRTRNGHQNKQSPEAPSSANNTNWGFEAESFTALPTATSQVTSPNIADFTNSQRLDDSKNKPPSQPAGWAGF